MPRDPGIRVLDIQNRTERKANAVQLLFSDRRGSLELLKVQPELQQDPGGGVLDTLWTNLGDNRVLRLRWKDTMIPPGGRARITVRAPGEKLNLLLTEWAVIRHTPDPFLFETQGTPYPAQFCWRAEQVAMPGISWGAQKAFFNFLDRETMTPASALWTNLGIADPDRIAALADIGDYVFAGFQQRRRVGGGNPYTAAAANPPAPPNCVTKLADLSQIFVAGFDASFSLGSPPGTPLEQRVDLEGIKDAFTLFGVGGLMLIPGGPTQCVGVDPSSPFQLQEYMAQAGQPNSANFVLFAEFAQACSTNGVDTVFWNRVLPSLVYSIQAFAAAYGSPIGATALDQFGPKLVPPGAVDLVALRGQRIAFETEVAGDPTFLPWIWAQYLCSYFDDPAAPCP